MIVVGVSSVTNYAKEGKFRELNKLKDDVLVSVVPSESFVAQQGTAIRTSSD